MGAAVIYCRISDDKRGDELGVKRQEKLCRELCDQLGWAVEHVYVDNDRTAYDPRGDRATLLRTLDGQQAGGRRRREPARRRPEYDAMLRAVRAGEVGAIVAWHPDRLHRSPLELEQFISVVEETNIEIRTVQAGHYDLTTASGRTMARVLGAMARGESEHKANRVRAKMEELARGGRPMMGGGRPFGYENDRVTIRESEAVIIREAVRRVLAGESMRSVARDFEERGIERVEGGRWVTSALRRTLLSPRIAGLRQHPRLGTTPGQWEGIISQATHERLKARISDPGRPTQRTPTRYLLSGLVVCGRCGTRLVARPRADKTRRYDCPSGPGYDGCGGLSCVAQGLEDEVAARVLVRLDSPAFASALKRHERGQRNEQAVLDALAELDERERELGVMAARHEITRPVLISANSDIEAQRRTLRAQLRDDSATASLAEYRGNSRKPGVLHQTWPDLDFEQQRAIVAAMVERVTLAPGVRGRSFFDPDRVSVTWKA